MVCPKGPHPGDWVLHTLLTILELDRNPERVPDRRTENGRAENFGLGGSRCFKVSHKLVLIIHFRTHSFDRLRTVLPTLMQQIEGCLTIEAMEVF